ncbi:MAG: nitrous oxide reductase accessory protein NosL [Deltaproteobacteria bacterium]|nr:nitrous oxide reductase accessory protein NosL [Deltaproteobacteria bacterium]
MAARSLRLVFCLLLLLSCAATAGSVPQPGPKDKCPVCGMFVARYPEWSASLTFNDGRSEFFDGVKDMLRFYHGLKRYAPRRRPAEIREMQVKDYYSLAFVDAASAWYVIGSDVLGPMGKEAVPFRGESDARSFLKDHHGTRILRFPELTPVIIKGLE